MRIVHGLERDDAGRPLALAIGFFDGFHRGHQEIARQTRRMRKPGWRCGVLTFADHPASFLRPGQQPPLIDTPAERLDRFADAGFEECFWVPFDEPIATLAPQAFLDLLVDRMRVRAVVVGSTFRFGYRRAGNVEMMCDYLRARNVDCIAVENAVDGGERISSTRIRRLIADGDVSAADGLLGGRGYEIRGTVELGAGRGHGLGFPTANLRAPHKLLPKDGVYTAIARFDGRDYPALVSIGTNPQFGGLERTIEAWLRDFRYTVYGKELALRDLRYLREQKLFGDVAELIEHMRQDVAAVAFPAYG